MYTRKEHMNNLIDITDLTDTQLDNLLGGVDAEQVAAALIGAGIEAQVEWSHGDTGKVDAGGLVVMVQNGRATVCKRSSARFGHGLESIANTGSIVSAHVAAVEAVLHSA
tara:strand:- start:273 stop:602 length:330 start_codon:yes stop_codon:yes gene_type:complete